MSPSAPVGRFPNTPKQVRVSGHKPSAPDGATASLWEFGEPVTWRYVSRGGWGYVWHVPAYVVKVTAKRVGIAALYADGESWVPRWVTHDRLLHGHPSLVARSVRPQGATRPPEGLS